MLLIPHDGTALPTRTAGQRLASGNISHQSVDILIIGNGITGLTAAVEARRLVPDKRIAIISEQSHPTINTPALKQFATGKLQREQLLAYPADTERLQHISVIHARVEAINAQSKYVLLANGYAVGYGVLLIATGSVAAGLPAHLPGRNFDGVLTLHRLHHYLDLRRRLPEVDEVVVIGGGAHAIETVATLVQLGIQTHWLIRGKTCLSRALDQHASDMVIQHLQQAGVRVQTETEVIGIAGSIGVVVGIVTNQQQMIPCQLVLVCTGVSPSTMLAERCNVPMMYEARRGIFVNNQLRTSVPGVYAAGDVAALNNPLTGVHETRAQWHSAVVQGYTAAAMMTGHDANSLRAFGVPWHATRLGSLSMLSVGNPLGRNEGAFTFTDTSRGGYRRLSLIDDRLVGYLSLGPDQPDGLAIKRLIDEGLPVRHVQRELCKGTFDAHHYFSQHHSQTVLTIATSGRIPTVKANITTNSSSAPLKLALPKLALPSSDARIQSRRLLSYGKGN